MTSASTARSREDVEANLERFGLPVPELVVGDVFERVGSGALDGVPVGVWYYDASHSYEAQLDGLRVAEPLLVPGALLIVDDTDWENVERALDDYLADQPRAREIVSLGWARPGIAAVVGGDARLRLGRVAPRRASDAADREPAVEDGAVDVVQREGGDVGLLLRRRPER